MNGTDVDRSSSVITWPSDKLYRQPSPVSYTVAVSIQSGIGTSFELHSLRFGADSQDHAVLGKICFLNVSQMQI